VYILYKLNINVPYIGLISAKCIFQIITIIDSFVIDHTCAKQSFQFK